MDRTIDTPVNLTEMDGDLVLQVPMPGAEPENIHIRIGDSDEIAVEATPRGKRAEPAQWHLHEWRVGDYNRLVKLPYAIDSAQTNATYNNGVLTISMPRGSRTTAREIRLHTISSGYGEQVGHRGHAERAH